MTKEYIDFKVTLRWHKPTTSDGADLGKISAKFECHDCTPTFNADSTPKDISKIKSIITSSSGDTKLSGIIQEGTAIADVLLPCENNIRKTFRDLWRTGKKIRLRLTYPHKTFDGDVAGGNEQIKQIMRIRWENICLPQNPTALPGLQHCLGTREEISIVHHLRKPDPNQSKELQADQLPVRVKFFSTLEQSALALGSLVKTVDERIFGELRQRMENRAAFFDIPPLDPDPAEIDVIEALQTDEFVHLTVHGNVNGVQVDDDSDNVLNQHEILKSFQAPNRPNVRAIILLSCNSASYVPNDSLNISAVLHRHAGVPIVIGTTGAIRISAAEKFVEGFYKAVGENPNINLEQAVPVGRDSILNMGLNPTDVPFDEMKWDASFGLPRLFLNSADSVLISLKTLFGSDYRSLYFDEMIERENRFKPLKYDPRDGDWKKVIDWLAKPERRWFLVTGLAGSGKSTQLTWLIDHLKNDSASHKIVYHFCQTETPKTVQPLDFVYNSLVPQLIDLYGEPYTNLLRNRIGNGKNPRLIGEKKKALAEFVSEPLATLKEKGLMEASDEPVIFIDGIDFVPPDRDLDNTILGLLDSASGRLDQVARILVTAEENLISSLNDQTKARELTDRVFSLTNHADDRKPDLEVKELLVDTPTFFGRMQENLKSYETKLEGWEDLYGLFDSQIETLEETYGKIISRLLDVVAVAREPLLAQDAVMIACFADDINTARVDEQLPGLLNDIQPFFKNFESSQQKLIFYHGWLQGYRLQNNRSAMLTHELFVKAFHPRRGNDWAKITDWSTLAETKWCKVSDAKYQNMIPTYQIDTMANYVKHYLVDHAYLSYITTAPKQSGARVRRKEALLDLICDPGYRTVRYYEIGSGESIQDLWRGLEVIYKEHLSNLSPEQRNNKEIRLAFNRLLAAEQPESHCSKALIKLEASLRRGQADKSALEVFLWPDRSPDEVAQSMA